MNNKYLDQSVGSIVTAIPQAAMLFQKLKVDFCCGGERKLAEALAEKNLDQAEVTARLDELENNPQKTENETDLTSMDREELAMLIEQQHHIWLRENMPLIGELFNKVLLAHGINHPDLFALHSLYSELRGKLEQHLVKEEAQTFPLYEKGKEAEKELLQLEKILREEHEHAGGILHEMRHTANEYTPPADACPTYSLLLRKLQEMESDLFLHIHKENNILFRKVQ